MRQLIGQQIEENIKLSVLQDMINEDLYQIKVSFSEKERMFLYMKSEGYSRIAGSFKVLGVLVDTDIIEYGDLDKEDEH